MTRIAVNGIPLLGQKSGIGNYVYQVFRAIQAMKGEIECDFFYGLQWSSEINVEPVKHFEASRSFIKRFNGLFYSYSMYRDLIFWKGQFFNRFDLYHETNYVPMNFKGPTIVNIYDLSFYHYPESHPEDRIRHMNQYFYSRLDRASHFITLSEAIKQELQRYLGIPPDKITVTPAGVDDKFKACPYEKTKSVILQYGITPDSYILYVGTLEPRKNIILLLNAYAELPYTLRKSFPLILTGGIGWLMGNLDSEIDRLGIRGTTHLTGYVPTESLPYLYSGASIFVYPSIYEGFGLPVLEAMACGAPVITSNVSSLPEVVGNAGVLIHPEDTKQLTHEMEDLLTNSVRRKMFKTMGQERAKQFTWKNCAQKTLDVYHKVLNNQ